MHKSILFLFCWLIPLPVLPAMAQTAPAYDLSALEEGSVFEYETSVGKLTSSFLGFFGEAFVFSSLETPSRGALLRSRMGVSQTGQLLWTDTITPEGIISYYVSPNDCSFILGRCQADLLFGARVLASISVETTYSDQVWIHIETTSAPSREAVTVYYCGVYNENSMTIALFMKDAAGESYWQRVISGPDAAISADALGKAKLACQQFPSNS